MRFGKWIFLSTLFTFLALNVDKLILGGVVSMNDLGIYAIALVFAKVALHVARKLGGTVLFPVYSRLQANSDRMMDVALRARAVVLSAGAAMCLSFVIAAPIFFKLWDERYHAAAPIAQWLGLYIWTMMLLLTMDRIPLAMGNSRALFVANVLRCCGIVVAVAGYIGFGLPGFIIGLALTPLIAFAYLLRHVPCQQKALVNQSIRFTLGSALYAVPALWITLVMQHASDFWTYVVVTLVIATLPPLYAAGVVKAAVRNDEPLPSARMAQPEQAI